ncbi:hypothetical protein LR48_Vigan08g159400 [Vigna angularis]|uniref:Uncharacterized protein n=1 Tax=Phaseolus angularis TaxID=3914 RepID=A0A0L9V758_PHAAN|nr:hypothetical protein LR48_Vigan08g159400 [Vigna angularis]
MKNGFVYLGELRMILIQEVVDLEGHDGLKRSFGVEQNWCRGIACAEEQQRGRADIEERVVEEQTYEAYETHGEENAFEAPNDDDAPRQRPDVPREARPHRRSSPPSPSGALARFRRMARMLQSLISCHHVTEGIVAHQVSVDLLQIANEGIDEYSTTRREQRHLHNNLLRRQRIAVQAAATQHLTATHGGIGGDDINDRVVERRIVNESFEIKEALPVASYEGMYYNYFSIGIALLIDTPRDKNITGKCY